MASSDVDYYYTETVTADDDILTNSTTNMCETPGSTALSSTPFVALVVVLYGVIMLGSVVGNGLVVYTITRNRAMRTVTNLLLLNLALGDLLLTLVCIPFVALPVLILQHWPFGLLLCQLVSCVQGIGVLVSAYTLIAVSGDRYRALRWPLRARLQARGALRFMVCIWLAAGVSAAPIAITSRLSQPTQWHQTCSRFMCREEWANEKHRYAYTITLLALQYIFPVICLLVTYTLIVYMVWNRAHIGEDYHLREVRALHARRKVIVMMIAVVTAFMICWLPLNVLLLVVEHRPEIEQWAGLPYLYLFCHWFAMSHACCNPIIYSWLNARFRAGFCLGLSKMPVIGKWIPHHTILDAADLVAGRSRRPSLRPDLASQQRRSQGDRASRPPSRPTSLSTAGTSWSAESPSARADAPYRVLDLPHAAGATPAALRRSRSVVAGGARPRTRFSVDQPRRATPHDDSDIDFGAILTPPSRPLLNRQRSVPAQRVYYQDIEEETDAVEERDRGWDWARANSPSSRRRSTRSRRTTSAPEEPTRFQRRRMFRRRDTEPSSRHSSNEMDIEEESNAVVEANGDRMCATRYTFSATAPSQKTFEMQTVHFKCGAESSSPQPRSSTSTLTPQRDSSPGAQALAVPHNCRTPRRLTASKRAGQMRRHKQDMPAQQTHSSSESRTPSPHPSPRIPRRRTRPERTAQGHAHEESASTSRSERTAQGHGHKESASTSRSERTAQGHGDKESASTSRSERTAQGHGHKASSSTLQADVSSDSESSVMRFIRHIVSKKLSESGMETRGRPQMRPAGPPTPPPPPPPRVQSAGRQPAVSPGFSTASTSSSAAEHLTQALQTVA